MCQLVCTGIRAALDCLKSLLPTTFWSVHDEACACSALRVKLIHRTAYIALLMEQQPVDVCARMSSEEERRHDMLEIKIITSIPATKRVIPGHGCVSA